MRDILKKLIVIIVLALMMVNSSLLMIISNAVEGIENNQNDEKEIEPKIEIGLEKYINYEIENNKELLLQVGLKTGIEYKENADKKEISKSEVEIQLPKIEEEYPNKVDIISKGNNENKAIKTYESSYDKETGKAKIVALNKLDEYSLICSYGEKAYTSDEKERKIEIEAKMKVTLNDGSNKEISTENAQTGIFTVTKNILGLICVNQETGKIYNGYIKSNKENGTKYKTEYQEKLGINISKEDISNETIIKLEDKLVNEKGEELDTQDIYFSKTKINKNDVIEYLGEEGYLEIEKEDGTVITRVDKNTQSNEDGTIEITYENEERNLQIKTSKGKKIGTLEIENTKQIKETLTNTEVNKIRTKYRVTSINKENKKDEQTGEEKESKTEVINYEGTNEVEINEAETKVDLKIDKQELTNRMQNDVILTATLVSNENKYNLFKNPTIEITLPNEVEKVILGNVSLLYENNLRVKNAEVKEQDGIKKIKIELEGQQLSYFENQMIQGTDILIPATIILKKDIQSTNSNISYTYTNDSGTVKDYEKEGKEGKQLEVNISSIMQTPQKAVMLADNVNPQGVDQELSVETNVQVGNDLLNDNDTVYEEEVINYTVKVTNNTGVTVNNIKIQGNIPNGTTYVEKDGTWIPGRAEYETERNPLYRKKEEKTDVTQTVDTLESGKSYVLQYKVIVNKLNEETLNTEINSTISVNGNNIKENKMNLQLKKAKLKVELYPKMDEINLTDRGTWVFEVKVTNLTDQKIDNVVVKTKLAEELNLENESSLISHTYDENKKILQLNIGTLDKDKTINIKVTPNNIKEDNSEASIDFSVTTKGDGTDEYRSDNDTNIAYVPVIRIEQSSETQGQTIQSNQEVKYKFEISNVGKDTAVINMIDNLPDGMIPLEANYETYSFNSESKEFEKNTNYQDMTTGRGDNDFDITTIMPIGGKITVEIKAESRYTVKTIEVENIAIIKGIGIPDKYSNSVKNTILSYLPEESEEPEEPDNPDNPSDPDNPDDPGSEDEEQNKEIKGTVWIDSNKDGKRDDSEEKLSGITVKLYNADTNKIETQKDGKKQIQITDNNGEYTFSSVGQGRYLVLFEYDTGKYSLTKYQEKGVSDSLNSDVILKTVSIDGKEQTVGLTNIIEVKSNNIEDIDMGLVKNEVFDFRLDKYVSKISVENSKGTKEYNYNNSKLAKVEIRAKEIDNTEVTIEYKIVVTNEGDTSGYIAEILDYIPNGLNFNSDNNKDWTRGKNGTIVNSSLSTQQIEPGESKEVTVRLNKKMTSEDTGTIVNAAEIGKSYNINNIKDKDSTEANQNKEEDDYSEANVIISIGTGLVRNIIIIVAIVLVGIGIFYGIKNKKISKLFIFSSIIVVGISIFNVTSIGLDTPSELDLNYKNLRWHCVNNNGTYKWEEITDNDGAEYWCMSPGATLQGKNTPVMYKYIRSQEADFYDYASLLNQLSGWAGAGWKTAAGLEFLEGKFTTKTSQDVKIKTLKITEGTGIENEGKFKYKYISNNQIIAGPFYLEYELEGILKENVKEVPVTFNNNGIICDENGNENTIKINNSVKGKKGFYVKMDDKLDINIKATLNLKDAHIDTITGVHAATYENKKKDVDSNYSTDAAQNLTKLYDISKEDKRDVSKTAKKQKTMPKCSLEIYKKDSKGQKLEGATIEVVGTSGLAEGYKITLENFSGYKKLTNLLPGTYKVTETKAPKEYNINLQKNKEQEIEIANGENKKATFVNKQYGNLRIMKIDEDTRKYLGKVGFIIRNNDTDKFIGGYTEKNDGPSDIKWVNKESEAKIFYTTNASDNKGKIDLKNIPEGSYSIKEVSIPNDLSGYYDADNKWEDVSVVVNSKGKKWYIERATKQILTRDEVLKSLKEQKTSNYEVVQKIYKGITGKGITVDDARNLRDKAGVLENYNKEQIENVISLIFKEKVTDERINNIYADADSRRAYIIGLYRQIDNNENTWGKLLETNDVDRYRYVIEGNSVAIKTNKQKYVDLSGYVWIDENASKASYRNDLWRTDEHSTISGYKDNEDIRYNGIKVRLKSKSTGKVINSVDDPGKKMETVTQGQGEYKFKKVSIDDLSDYYVEFEYGGLTYTNVIPHLDRGTGSKAIENSNERKQFNQNFSVVEGTGETTGITRDTNGNQKHKLQYNVNKNEHTSTIVNPNQYTITANTKDSGYNIKWTAGVTEIKNINLGLYRREQPDISLVKDLDNIKITVNGYNHVYQYAQRFVNQKEYGNGFNIGVKYGSKYGSMSYSRAIYQADYKYVNEKDKSRELKVYVTYRLAMRNEATNLNVKVNSIADYYDKRYTITKVGTGTNKGDITGEISHTETAYNNKYTKTIINNGTQIDAQKEQSIYVQFELNKEAVLNIINAKTNLDNVAEINSYSVYDKTGNIYAGIDTDSNPGSVNPEDKSTYQDDTDSSPALKLEVADPRVMTGKVFLDATDPNLNTAKVRQGNGKYDEKEKGIEGVEVTLKENTGSGKEYKTKTDQNGDFKIDKYIPGDYTLTYTWGDKTYTVQNYKGTVYNAQRDQKNKQWYKVDVNNRLTDALDDYKTREDIDKETATIVNNTTTTIDKMNSTTPTMGIGVEYESVYTASSGDRYIYEIKNVDFGIVERARQELELQKRVETFKVTLANGQVVTDVTIDENGKITGEKSHMTYMGPSDKIYPKNGFIKVELDNELIQGALVEVGYKFTAKNNSELDYKSEQFYKYGIVDGKVITMTPAEVIDYLDNSWAFEQEKNTGWEVKQIGEIEDIVSAEVFKNEGTTVREKTILYTNKLAKPIEPGKINSITLNVSKKLTTTDEISLGNETEITKIERPGGSVPNDETPGNYIPGKGKKEVDDSIAETVIVTPSTGDNKSIIIPISIGVVALVILATGVVLIKKKVIHKEK